MMKNKKSMKKYDNDILDTARNLSYASVGTALAGGITQKMGGNAAGIQTFASGLPMIATASTGGIVIKKLKKLNK